MSKIILGTLRPPLATNATAGIIKGGDDITIGTGGEPVVNTNYDTVDINTDANIQNIVKGMKFKSILGNIVSALMGLNGDVSKINSDLAVVKTNKLDVSLYNQRHEAMFFRDNLPITTNAASLADIIAVIGRNGTIYSNVGNLINPDKTNYFVISLSTYGEVIMVTARGSDGSFYPAALVNNVWSGWKVK